MKVEIPEKDEVTGACGVVFEEKVKVGEELSVAEFVFGAGRGAVETGKDDRLAGEFGHSLDKFKRGVSER